MPIPEMSLLTPTEFVHFQSFLSSIDHNEHAVAPEWSMYAAQADHHPHHVQGSESLTKATKDLLSLEQSTINEQQHQWQHSQHYPSSIPHQTRHSSLSQQYTQTQHIPQTDDRYYSDYEYRYDNPPTRPVSEHFPFLKPPQQQRQQRQELHSYSPQLTAHPNSSDLYARAYPPQASSNTTNNNQHQLPHSHPHTRAGTGPTPPSSATSASPPPHSSIRSSSPASSSSKRNLDGAPSSSAHPLKRSRASTGLGQKPALLSPSQKKANHIQSEQKRRANIRKGYEALCDTVPELREAIREEEAALAADGGQSKARSKRAKGNKAKADDAGDKPDGRAGPRSENVVLSKTIDYINELLAEQDSLTSRLAQARSQLSPDHPALHSTCEPLWERQWTGGTGKTETEADDDEEDHS